jgi:A/G-specific adenine glycosylase
MEGITGPDFEKFRELIHTYYRRCGRRFPWRETRDPYKITVSEIMLQQTGTERVLKKYGPFLHAFPSFSALAAADLKNVLLIWQGLGYNRRAKALREIAGLVVSVFGGVLPEDPAVLLTFPGIGPGTAGSIAAFTYNRPAVFIETNIRRVFLHFFFENQDNVRDTEILPLVEETLDRDDPREWYYGLMDYGVYLKSLYPNPNTRSAHYTRQAKFAGSNRQIRGRILAVLSAADDRADAGGGYTGRGTEGLSADDLARKSGFPLERVLKAVSELAAEGFVAEAAGKYEIAGSGFSPDPQMQHPLNA